MARRYHQGPIREVSVDDWATAAMRAGTDPADTAFTEARTTGLPIKIPPGTWVLEQAHPLVANGQRWLGAGDQSIIKPVGNFNIFEFGFTGGGLFDVYIDGALQTGGYVIYSAAGNRLVFSGIKGTSPYNLAYVQQANQATFRDFWVSGVRGSAMFSLYGSPALRSDVIDFRNVTVSADIAIAEASRAKGLIWDGNIHTVDTTGLRLIAPSIGLHCLNSAGGTFPNEAPAFGDFKGLQIDFPALQGILLESSLDMKFTQPYVANCLQGEGISIGAQAKEGSILGGIIENNFKEGIVAAGEDWEFAGVRCALNSLGAYGSYSGIRVTGARNKFSGCHSGLRYSTGAIQKFGLENASGATDTSWAGGYLGGNIIEPWHDADGTLTVVGAAGTRLSVTNSMLIGTAAGFGARLGCTVSGGGIASPTVTAAGRHYSVAPTLFAFDPASTGSGFTGTATVNAAGGVASWVVNTPGSGYSAGSFVYALAGSGEAIIRPYSSSNVSGRLYGSGSGGVFLANDQGGLLLAANVANTVNYIETIGVGTGSSPAVAAIGTDANLDLLLRGQGTGVVDLSVVAAGSAGALAGYAVLKVNGVSVAIPFHTP